MSPIAGAVGTLRGTLAPDFRLQNDKEEWITLSEEVKKSPVMLAFYPADFSPVCTQQLCNYQEAYQRFVDYGIKVFAISPNIPEDHQRFKKRYQFAFDLLSDPNRKVAKTYKITSLFLLGGASRAVFILAKGGRIVYRYVEPTPLTRRKADELLDILDNLKKKNEI